MGNTAEFELIKMLPEQKIVFATDGLEFNL